MIKKLITLFITVAALATNVSARNPYNFRSCPKFYVGVSTGLENQSGVLGPNFDIPLLPRLSFGVGAGRSTWGFKGYSEARVYLGECNRQLALGTGVTYNTGIKNYTTLLPTTGGDANVDFELHPSLNAFASIYYFFNLGREGDHRFYLQTGYSYPISTDVYTIESDHVLTADGETVMQILRPGGVIFALGFSFGFGG